MAALSIFGGAGGSILMFGIVALMCRALGHLAATNENTAILKRKIQLNELRALSPSAVLTVTTQSANFRSSPSVDDRAIIRRVPFGTQFQLAGAPTEAGRVAWCRVVDPRTGERGFLNADVIACQ
jgi:hypothetical protein